MDNKWRVSPSPHLRSGVTTRSIMLDVIIALCPALIAAGAMFGFAAIITVILCVISCVVTEWVARKLMKRDNTISDLSAVVTGILLAFNLPPTISPVIAVLGGVIAIGVVKQMFGGLGQNFVNPAITARIILMVSFPAAMSTWIQPFHYQSAADAVSSATPLGILKEGGDMAALPSTLELLLGIRSGCLGEVCALALIMGGLYLMARKVISPAIPLCYIGTVFVMTLLLGQDPVFHVLSGGLLLGAFFMATDYATSPISLSGKIIFGIGCGVLTVLIRLFSILPEGVSFSIILMNILVPHIERLTQPKPFGEERKRREKA